jgi:hypothetical protein
MFVHRDWPASENGAMPLALNFGIRSRMSPFVVEQHDRLHGLDRHRVDLAVDRGRAERRRQDLLLDRVVLAEPVGQVDHLAGVDVRLETATAPAPDHRRGLAGADRRLDLLLVGVVLEERRSDLGVGVRLVEAVDRRLADRLAGLTGQRPVAGPALRAAAAGTALVGRARAATCREGRSTGGPRG